MLRVKFNVDVRESVRRGKPSSSPCTLSLSDSDLAGLEEQELASLAGAISLGSRNGGGYVVDVAAEKAAAEAEKVERNAWIAQHGSPRLKRMVAENIEHQTAYRDERLALERPGWVWYSAVDGDTDVPRNPPMEAFTLLDEARKVDPDAELAWYRDGNDSEYAAESMFLGKRVLMFVRSGLCL